MYISPKDKKPKAAGATSGTTKPPEDRCPARRPSPCTHGAGGRMGGWARDLRAKDAGKGKSKGTSTAKSTAKATAKASGSGADAPPPKRGRFGARGRGEKRGR